MALFSTFNKRIIILGAGCIIWAIILVAHLFYYTVIERDKYLEMSERLALRKMVIIPPRGSIYDKNHVRLAWSEQRYDLWLTKPLSAQKMKRLKKALQHFSIVFRGDEPGIIKKDISPQQIKALADLSKKYDGVAIKMVFIRKYINNRAVKRYLGEVENHSGVLVGVSGKEKELNQQLRGEDGEYTVMVDRKGNWIDGTFSLKKEEKQSDVYLDRTF